MALALLLAIPVAWARPKTKERPVLTAPELQMDGGRRLTFERSFRSEREVKPKRGFFAKVIDVVAGEPDFHQMVRPYSVEIGRASCRERV